MQCEGQVEVSTIADVVTLVGRTFGERRREDLPRYDVAVLTQGGRNVVVG